MLATRPVDFRKESLPEDQLLLGVEAAEQIEAAGADEESEPVKKAARVGKRRTNLGVLLAHLPRVECLVDIDSAACPSCSGSLHWIGEDVSERLDVVPVQFWVLVIRRPRYACHACGEVIVQAPAPARLIEGGLPTDALVAQVLVSKYADQLPLRRQAQIFARQGVSLDRSTLADWVGRFAFLVRPVHERLLESLKRSGKLFADKTTAPVLDPGRGRTKTGELWAYARDDRPRGGIDPPGVAYNYAPDRTAGRPIAHLSGFAGVLQIDGYAAYESLTKDGAVRLAHCWSNVRRQFYVLAAASPIATETLARIAMLYRIEAEIRGRPAEERRAVRQERSRPVVEALEAGCGRARPPEPQEQIGGGDRYALTQLAGQSLSLDVGLVEIDPNTVERAIRPPALRRKNALFAGSDGGGRHWAVIDSLIKACKLVGVKPQAYLADVITRIIEGHPQWRLDELLPWAYPSTPTLQAVAQERSSSGESVEPREPAPEQRPGLAQSHIDQHHRLGVSDRIGDERLGVETTKRGSVEAHPGLTLVVERQPQKGEYRLVDALLIDRHSSTLERSAQTERGASRSVTVSQPSRAVVRPASEEGDPTWNSLLSCSA